MASPAMYDPYNYISFVELNKRKRGEHYDRPKSQRLENRTARPAVKRIYLKKNGDASYNKPKLYMWRQWQAPSLDELTELAGDFVGIHDAMSLYDHSGRRVVHAEDIRENATYYVAGDESFYPSNNQTTPARFPPQPPRSKSKIVQRKSQNRADFRKLLEQPLSRSTSRSDLPANPYDEAILFRPIGQNALEIFPERSYYSIKINQNESNGNLNEMSRARRATTGSPPEDRGKAEFLTYTSAHSRHGIRRPVKQIPSTGNRKKTRNKTRNETNNSPKTVSMFDYEEAFREALETPRSPTNTVDQPSTSLEKNPQTSYDYYSNEKNGRSAKTRGKDHDYYDDYERRHSAKYSAKSRVKDFDDYDSDDYDHRHKQHSAPAGYQREKHSAKPRSRRARSTSSKRNLEDSMISDFHDEEAELKDRLALERHKQKNLRYNRSHSAQIFNRKDQTNPNAYIIYVFLNGNGMDCQYVDFSRSQLEKGMPYVLELCARKYKVNPARLVNMDGKRINDVSDMMSRGAYVLIPVGQNFRDTWYFLPDNAIDTSSDAEKVRARSAQRDRYIQKKERDERKKTPHKRSKSSDYYRR